MTARWLDADDASTGDEPEWRVRVRAAVERTVRRRAARAEQRRLLDARRAKGLQLRHAEKLARADEWDVDTP